MPARARHHHYETGTYVPPAERFLPDDVYGRALDALGGAFLDSAGRWLPSMTSARSKALPKANGWSRVSMATVRQPKEYIWRGRRALRQRGHVGRSVSASLTSTASV